MKLQKYSFFFFETFQKYDILKLSRFSPTRAGKQVLEEPPGTERKQAMFFIVFIATTNKSTITRAVFCTLDLERLSPKILGQSVFPTELFMTLH